MLYIYQADDLDKETEKLENQFDFAIEGLDGIVRDMSVKIYVYKADYVTGEGLEQLKKHRKPFTIIHHSLNFGMNMYEGDEQHSTKEDMMALFETCKSLNIEKKPPHFTAVIMHAGMRHLGTLADALTESDLVNARSTQSGDGEKEVVDPVRFVTWQKTGKFSQKGGRLAYDTEVMALGFHTKPEDVIWLVVEFTFYLVAFRASPDGGRTGGPADIAWFTTRQAALAV